jgi:hypothetical protein
MRTTLLVCLLAFLALADTLQAADPWVGTWKMNVAKSTPVPAQPGRAVKEATLVIQAIGERYDATLKGARENGSAISSQYSEPLKGGPRTYSEGAPPAGTSIAANKINDSTIDHITTRDGKVVLTRHVTVSANGKTMRDDIKGLDAQGKAVHGMELWDKQ